MNKYTLGVPALIGFAAENIEPNTVGKILVKNPLTTSDDPDFHIYIKHISNIFFSKLKIPTHTIEKALILIHKNNTSEIYINDFKELARARINKNTGTGEYVSKKDISDITHLRFSDIKIDSSDEVIYLRRVDWKFGLFFDLTRQINISDLESSLGKLLNELIYQTVLQSARSDIELNTSKFLNVVFTEGETDKIYIRKATKKLFIESNFKFGETVENGEAYLLRLCKDLSKVEHNQKIILIFDRDNPNILTTLENKKVKNKQYQSWGNNVYSFAIPIPAHRKNQPLFSIEFYFKDSEITRLDNENRRLYLNNEFNTTTGRHKSEDLICKNMNKIKNNTVNIVDNEVYDKQNINRALPKNKFAENILKNVNNYNDFDFNEFKKILEVIEEIIEI